MAENPYNPAAINETPDARAPDDYQRIDANPDQFGALIGQGLSQAGRGATEASNNLFNIGQVYQKVSVDDQINHLLTQKEYLFRGDPGKPIIGPDGQPQADVGYMGLQGRSALDQRESTMKSLDAAIEKGRSNLSSEEEKREYDHQTQRLKVNWLGDVGSHADTQFKTWAQGVNEAGAAHAISHIASNPDNPEEVAHGANDLINFRVKQAELKFGDDPKIKLEAIAGAKQEALKAQIEAISVKDPQRAQSILEKNRNIAGAEYENLSNQLRSRADRQIGDTAGAQAVAPATMPRAPLEIASRFVGAEEHAQRDVLSKFIGNIGGQSVDPVTTAWCAAFVNGVLQKAGIPGSDSLSARSLLNVGTAVGQPLPGDVVVLSRGDPASGQGHTGFYVGPGSTPGSVRILAGNQSNSVGYGEFPADQVLGIRRVSKDDIGRTPQVDTIAMRPTFRKADAYQKVIGDPNLTPEQRSHAFTYINQTLTAQQIAYDQDIKAKREANDQAANGYVSRMLQGDMKGMTEQIANDPYLSWETKRALGDAAEKQSGNDVREAEQAYGKGFWPSYKSVLAPFDDPNRISDPTELLRRAGPNGDLTLSGVQKLSQVLQQNQKSVDGQAVNTSKVGLMNYAKSRLSFEQDTGPIKIRDPKGEAIFNAQFIPKFESAFDKWVKDGKNPWEFLTQENIDKMMTGMRSKSEMAMERMAAMGESSGDPSGTPLPPPPDGVDVAAWTKIIAAPPAMETGKPFPHSAWASAIGMLLKTPTPETIKLFDESKFGKSGYKGSEIVDQLVPKKVSEVVQ